VDAQRVPSSARRASARDLDTVVETLTLAFAQDPVWRPSLESGESTVETMREFWRIHATDSLRLGWLWTLEDAAAVASWIPPGETELSHAGEARLEEFRRERLGSEGAAALETVFDRFEAAHPRDRPHYYLSLLGTHPASRGQGLGMGLLRTTLEVIDGDGSPSYLESSNPSNDARYQSAGFQPVVRFELPAGQIVTGMWREKVS
jgi:GNAT superfamily N-acetyltransferase